MAGQLSAFGYALSDNADDADLWLINTWVINLLVLAWFLFWQADCHTHTHTHTQKQREREMERGESLFGIRLGHLDVYIQGGPSLLILGYTIIIYLKIQKYSIHLNKHLIFISIHLAEKVATSVFFFICVRKAITIFLFGLEK